LCAWAKHLCAPKTLHLSLPEDLTIFNFFYCEELGSFHSTMAHFVTGVWWWTHVSSPLTMFSRNSSPTLYHCKSDTAQAIRCFLMSSIGAQATQHARTWLHPKFWMSAPVQLIEVMSQFIHHYTPVVADYIFHECTVVSTSFKIFYNDFCTSKFCAPFHYILPTPNIFDINLHELVTCFLHSKTKLQHRMSFLLRGHDQLTHTHDKQQMASESTCSAISNY
jgi:hypothetical protein